MELLPHSAILHMEMIGETWRQLRKFAHTQQYGGQALRVLLVSDTIILIIDIIDMYCRMQRSGVYSVLVWT